MLGAALAWPALAWKERASPKMTGPHFAALEVATLYKGIMGKFPEFSRDDDG